MPHPSTDSTWNRQDDAGKTHRVMALPDLKECLITMVDMKTWKTLKTLPALGPGVFLRGHHESAYVRVDVFSGTSMDAMHVIDKPRLEIVATLRPEPGKTTLPVAFDRYGKYALVSLAEMDGALIVFDAKSLMEIKRLPMKRPLANTTCETRPN